MTITPFSIEVQHADMQDLHDRIERVRLPRDLAFEGNRGIRPQDIASRLAQWKSFDWAALVQRVNGYPQFIAEIQDQRIHFFHVQSSREDAIPLMLLHGFPSSPLEFLPVIESLTEPNDDSQTFHLVIPSHPGYGYSTPLNQPSESLPAAGMYAQLMAELGYERYLAHGGDYGAFIAPDLGRIDPDHVMGIHVSAASVGFIPFHEVEGEEFDSLTSLEQQKLANLANYMNDMNWYYDVQAKRPQTISYGMADSPAALLSWLAELFLDFSSDPASIFDQPENREIFFGNLTLWWLTNCFGPAANTYWEAMHSENWPTKSEVPTGVASSPEDASIRRYSEDTNTIVHWTDLPQGGHFLAMEQPGLMVEDIRRFVAACR